MAEQPATLAATGENVNVVVIVQEYVATVELEEEGGDGNFQILVEEEEEEEGEEDEEEKDEEKEQQVGQTMTGNKLDSQPTFDLHLSSFMEEDLGGDELTPINRREPTISDSQRSPFLQREVEINGKISENKRIILTRLLNQR